MSVMSDSAEDRIMATAHSVTLWLQQFKQGDREAVGPLWDRYFTRLVHLARNRFPRTAATGAASAQDVALEAFASFCRRAEEDGFASLSDRDDLWQLLVVLAFRKRCNQIKHEQRQRRHPTGGHVYAASALAVISHHPACPVATLPPWTPDGGLVMATTRLRPAVPPPWPPIPRFHLPLPLPSRAISSFFSLFPR